MVIFSLRSKGTGRKRFLGGSFGNPRSASLGSRKWVGSLGESKQLVETVVKPELRPEEGHGQGNRWHEPARTSPRKCEVPGLMTDILE